MPFWRLYYHLIWTTKNREPVIQPDIEPRLYAFLVRKAHEMDVQVYAVNGWHDHVHMIVGVPPKHALADVVKGLKGASSRELDYTGLIPGFQWQRGYGALSLGHSQLLQAEEYVRSQKQHHEAGNSSAWLEYATELDEGPMDPNAQRAGRAVREDESGYGWGDAAPF